MERRVCLIVLDSFGVGALPDAVDYGDEGANTLNQRRDIDGYAKALRDFDARVPEIMDAMYSKSMEKEKNMGEKESFTWISEVVEDWLGIKKIGGN